MGDLAVTHERSDCINDTQSDEPGANCWWSDGTNTHFDRVLAGGLF